MSICNIECEFQKAGEGKLDCSESDGEVIYGESECRVAAKALGYSSVIKESNDNYPKGCYAYSDGKAYVNNGVGGTDASRMRFNRICLITGNFLTNSALHDNLL